MSQMPPPPSSYPSGSPQQPPQQPPPGQGPTPPLPPPKKGMGPFWIVIIILSVCLVFCVCGVGMLAAIAVPNFLEAQVRSQVSRARSDMRSLATAIETYYIDNNNYPASTTDPAESINASLAANSASPQLQWDLPTFASHHATGAHTLTTPIAYLTSYFPDPFSPVPGRTFNYYKNEGGWILWSAGPDNDYDLNYEDYDPRYMKSTYDRLYRSTYDPTNGTASSGDIWRVKQ